MERNEGEEYLNLAPRRHECHLLCYWFLETKHQQISRKGFRRQVSSKVFRSYYFL